jgi:hypothetical protein
LNPPNTIAEKTNSELKGTTVAARKEAINKPSRPNSVNPGI